MDEDDEFGDLYADVLRPVPSSSPQPPSFPSPPKPQISVPSAPDREEDWILGPAPIPEDPPLDWNEDENDRPAAPDPPHDSDAAATRDSDEGKVDGEQGIGEFDIEIDIPGLGAGAVDGGVFLHGDVRGPVSEDWDSDSDDDLRIVLNDDSMMGVKVGGGVSEEDEDGEDDLVIVADDGQHHQYQGMEEQDWGEDALQAGLDGEKELDGAAKGLPGVGVVAGQRVGYGHAYHLQHPSQFKYVRPGAVDIPGAAAVGHGGAPGQLRPPLIAGLAAGRGRGALKSFHSGYSIPTWANNNSTRPFGIGLDFTLPSHKTIFEINIDVFEEKPWRLQGIDITDFFNFGLDEVSWKAYCKQLEQFRLESTMQSKIRVYESGRSDRDYDPDLPPELAAASGLQDISAEITLPGKLDSGQLDAYSQGLGATQRQFQLPTGRAIQVESGYGERLPSMDTRPPRTRDIEAIIEIVCQDFVDDSDKPHIGLNQLGGEPIAGSSNGCYQTEEINRPDDLECNGHFSHSQNGRGDAICCEDSSVNIDHINALKEHDILEFPKKASSQDHHRSNTEISSCAAGNSEEPQDKRQDVDKIDKTIDNDFDADNGLELSLSNDVENAKELSLELKDEEHDDKLMLLDNPDADTEDLPSDVHLSADSQNDDMSYSAKRQKLNSQIKKSALLDNGDAEATFSDHSKEKSWSSMDYMKQAEAGDAEVVQVGSRHSDDLDRDHSECVGTSQHRDDYVQDPQHELNRSHIPSRGREDLHCSHQQRNPDSNLVNYECTEDLERLKERGSSVAWNRRDSETYDMGRRDRDAKRRHNDETRFRDKTRPLINDRKGRDADPYLRKNTDSNDWRAHYNREGALRQRERYNTMMKPQEYSEDAPINRRMDEDQHKRDTMPKESLYGSQTREDVSHRRGRNDNLENRNKDDLTRVRDRMGNQRSVKHKDDIPKPRERDDRQRLKVEGYTHAHRERGEVRSGTKSSRTLEEKSYGATVKIRGDHKGSDNDLVLKEGRNNQPRRGDRTKGENHSQHKSREGMHAGLSQVSREERNSRHGRLNSQGAHISDAFSNQHGYREIDRENSRKSKNSAMDKNDLLPAKRKREDITIQQGDKGSWTLPSDSSLKEGDNGSDNVHPKRNHHLKHEDSGDPHVKGKDATISDDENQHESRGRSKLERWTSHKERDYSMNRAQSSLKTEAANGNVVLCDELTMTEVDKTAEKNGNSKESTPTVFENSLKEEHDRHLETFEKLKKRSERFNLPMPSEKEALANKRLENEPSLANNESLADTEVKQERPTRKRRWVSS